MKTYIALFRGINVGGNNVLPMNDLAALLPFQGRIFRSAPYVSLMAGVSRR